MPLFISGKKSYCPWKRENLERVRRDEARKSPHETSRKRRKSRSSLEDGVPLVSSKSPTDSSPFALINQKDMSEEVRAKEEMRKLHMDPMKEFTSTSTSLGKSSMMEKRSSDLPKRSRSDKKRSLGSRRERRERSSSSRRKSDEPTIQELRARRLERECVEQIRQQELLGAKPADKSKRPRYHNQYHL